MIRALHVTQSITAAAGGTSTAFVELIEALRAQAGSASVRAVTQALPDGDEARDWVVGHEPGLWTFTGPPGRLRPGAIARGAAALIDSGQVDVVHLHGLWLADLVAIARSARARGVPVVWQPHGMLVQAALRRSRLKKLLFRLLTGLSGELARADAVVFTSETERDTSNLSFLGRAGRRAVIPLPVAIPVADTDLPAMVRAGRRRWLQAAHGDPGQTLVDGKPQPDMNAPLLAFMGRLHPVKRVELAIDALAIVRRTTPEIRLLLIGDGEPAYVRTLRDRARERGVGDALVFAGWLSGTEKWQALAAADALVIQSEFENFGYAIVEALVAGTPAVMTSNLSLARAVADLGAGVTAEPAPEAFAGALGSILARSDRRAMGLRGRRWVEATFSRAAVGAQLVALYRTLLEGRAAR